jgi:hypothetical protein
MTTHSKDLCRCGSGKKYKHCHQRADAARRRNLLLLGAAVVLVAGTAAIAGPGLWSRWNAQRNASSAQALADSAARAEMAARPGATGVLGTSAANGAASIGVVNPNGVAGPPLRDPDALTLKPPNSGELAPGEHPKDWEYDVARNRYYDPREGHKHWHSGPPPADPNAPAPVPNIVVTTPDGRPIQVTTSNVKVTQGTVTVAPPKPATPPASTTKK